MTGCTCATCRSFCERHPGLFAPGQVERLAEYLSLSVQEVFARHLVAEWSTDGRIMALRPATVSEQAGSAVEAPADFPGRCVFLTDAGRCSVHATKPLECRRADHEYSDSRARALHNKVGKLWAGSVHQAQIARLLAENNPKAFRILSEEEKS